MTATIPQTLFSFLSMPRQKNQASEKSEAVIVHKSSISNAGQTQSTAQTEYLGRGGFMESKLNYHKSNIINCTDLGGDQSIGESQWYFAELCGEYMDVQFFEDYQSDEIQDYKDILSWCVSVLDCSPSARVMLKEARDKDWQVKLADLGGTDYYIDVAEKLLILDNNELEPDGYARSSYFKNIMLVSMVKALRDIWQEKRYGGFDEIYSADHIMLMERIRAADLDVVAVLSAWELRSEEYSDLWRHMIGSELGDMAMLFSGFVERDPSARFNGQGLLATFKQWFISAVRVDACDHDTLEYMDDVLFVSDGDNPFGKKKPARMNIEMLSCLPDKSAYLQGMGAEIMSDPLFSAVDNEINQTHLLHIMRDIDVVIVENVPFRDAELARLIFPEE